MYEEKGWKKVFGQKYEILVFCHSFRKEFSEKGSQKYFFIANSKYD